MLIQAILQLSITVDLSCAVQNRILRSSYESFVVAAVVVRRIKSWSASCF